MTDENELKQKRKNTFWTVYFITLIVGFIIIEGFEGLPIFWVLIGATIPAWAVAGAIGTSDEDCFPKNDPRF